MPLLWYRSGHAVNDTAGSARQRRYGQRRSESWCSRVAELKPQPFQAEVIYIGPGRNQMNHANSTCTSPGRIVRQRAAACDAGLAIPSARPPSGTGRAAGGAGYRASALPDTGPRCRQAATRFSDVIALRSVLRRMLGLVAVAALCAGTIANAQSEELTRRELGLQFAAAKPSGATTVAKAPRILQVLFSRSSAEQDDFRLLAPSPLIVVTARFDQAVTVDTAYGVPKIDLEMGTPPLRQGGYVGSYAGGSGSDELRFQYATPHYATLDWYQDVGHVEINANAIRLRGSTIRGIDHFAAASLAHAPVAATANNAGARSKSALVRTPLPALERSPAPHGGGSDAGLVVDAAAQAAAVPPPSAIRLRSEVLIAGHQLRHWRTFGNGAHEAVVPIPGARSLSESWSRDYEVSEPRGPPRRPPGSVAHSRVPKQGLREGLRLFGRDRDASNTLQRVSGARSGATARPPGPTDPSYPPARAYSRFRFHAVHTRLHSPSAPRNPRR